jgi:hypothetical protein
VTRLAALAALLPGLALADCPPAAADGRLVQRGTVVLAWRALRAAEPPIVVGEHFALLVQVCPADARLARVDASMPEHRHGMNYRPGLQALGGGRWRAEGLMFHMAGRWELVFDVVTGSTTTRLADDVMLR